MDTLQYFATKYDLDLSQEGAIEIPGVSRLDIIRWLRELDFQRGAEIGVYIGEFTHLLLRGNPQLMLYAVDAWEEHDEYNELGGMDFDDLYARAHRRLAEEIRKKRCVMIRKYSMDALEDVEDESLDFVYIDANHVAPFVQQDIEGWAKKVRKGGIVSGHDYISQKSIDYDIIRATNEYTKKHGHKLFVLGSKEVKPRVVRERIRSWMFIK